MDVDMVEAGVHELFQLLEMPRRVGAAENRLLHVFLTRELGRTFEELGGRELGRQRS